MRDAKDEIIKSAIKLFSKTGYDGTSTTKIAKDCDVTQPLIHYHFGSKLGLWKSCVDKIFESVNTKFIKDIMQKSYDGSPNQDFMRFLLIESFSESERTKLIEKKLNASL